MRGAIKGNNSRPDLRHQVVSQSLPNFHYTSKLSPKLHHPDPSLKLPLNQPQPLNPQYSSSAYKLQPSPQPHTTSLNPHDPTSESFRKTANLLLLNSPYNGNHSYSRYYTQPDEQLNLQYNQLNGYYNWHRGVRLGGTGRDSVMKKQGKGRASVKEVMGDQRFNKFDGMTTYRADYQDCRKWGDKGKGKEKGMGDYVCGTKEYSHRYGKQEVFTQRVKTLSDCGSPYGEYYQTTNGKYKLDTQTEYRKHFTKPQQTILFKNQPKDKNPPKKSTRLWNLPKNRIETQPNFTAMQKYYLTLKNK